jgi:alkanesulfonate monooxygenase SsuD/methylene tetrahydromethanopterin reductase-like flavin-dependent oxidoreductase (luciferase family)
VGGAFPYGARRAIAYGDGWYPHAARPQYGDILDKLSEFRQMCAAAGRDPASCPVTVSAAPQTADAAKRYRDAGVERIVYSIASDAADKTLPLLDQLADIMRRVG